MMHSYRFLIGVVLSVVLVGALSTIDLTLAGQRPERAFAQDVGPLARLAAPAVSDRMLDSVSGQPQGQFNFGGGFQLGGGGGFNIGGGGTGFQFGGGGFNIGGTGFQLGGGGFNIGGGGGFQFGGGGFTIAGGGAGFQLGGGGFNFGGQTGFAPLGGVLTPRGWVPILGFPPPTIMLPPPPPVVVPVYEPPWAPAWPGGSAGEWGREAAP